MSYDDIAIDPRNLLPPIVVLCVTSKDGTVTQIRLSPKNLEAIEAAVLGGHIFDLPPREEWARAELVMGFPENPLVKDVYRPAQSPKEPQTP